VTDQTLLSDLQTMVIEPRDNGATWPSGLWTAAEVLGYLNQRQNRFLKESAIVVARANVLFATTVAVGALPTDWIATIRVTWRDDLTGAYSVMYPGSKQTADWGYAAWGQATGQPLLWSDSDDPPPVLRVLPAPLLAGRAELVYVATALPCTGAGINLTVPDAFTPYLRYGVLADMYGKQGRAFDASRAGYAEGRFAEGVELARRLVNALARRSQ